MGINWNLYENRLNINGSSKRERDIYDYKQTLTNKLPDSPSCKAVKINGVDRSLELVKTSKDSIKIIHSLPDETFNCGDYVLYKTITYLITEFDKDDEINTTGKMEETNYILKFQHPTTGAILSYPCITSNKSFSENEGKVISLGANQKSILLRMDENTLLLKADMRFFVDKKSPPTPHKLIGDTDTTSQDGLISFVVEQDELKTANIDRVDLGVCDYFEPTPIPEPVDPTTPTRVVTISSNTTNDEIKLGLTYTFSSIVKNELGEVITVTQPRYTVDNTYGDKVILVDSLNGTCTVKAKEYYSLLGNQFSLQCMDMISGFSSAITFTIVALW